MNGGDRWYADSGRWPWISVGACGLAGSLGAWAAGLPPSGVFWLGIATAYAGLVPGILAIGLWRLRQEALRRREAAGRADLWDAWLDEDGITFVEFEPDPGEVTPAFAPVRPRVLSPDGASFPLEVEIYPFLKGEPRGAIRIGGPTGSGKSTALRHLLATLPPELDVRAVDDPDAATVVDRAAAGLVVYAADTPAGDKHLATFFLAPWDQDELIEYLLAVAPDQCGSVMARLKSADDRSLADGNPELWRVALDRMIADESIAGVRQALRSDLDARLVDPALRERIGDHCLTKLGARMPWAVEPVEQVDWPENDATLDRLIRHRPIQWLLAADWIVAELANPDVSCSFLIHRLPRELVREAGLLIHDRPEVADRLASIFDESTASSQPMAASLLHAADLRWRPRQGSFPRLTDAYLDRVDWLAIALPGAEMLRVDLRGAGLCKATLDNAKLDQARLGQARLMHASLRGASACGADLVGADLTSATADGAFFTGAKLVNARFDSASVRGARFAHAILAGASFQGADLTAASLELAIIDGADFSGATLESAILMGLTLSKANFAGAMFAAANLSDCNLEGMALAGARFAAAKFNNALLTSSIMPQADFRKADLRNAGLAEVCWEGACLAGSDLRGASFHLGSSRSGLVGSPIASEGSRTGFYTDDFDEQGFKSPEEIRKADLRGVDLRGADLRGVDFYLVDLRGATFDPGRADQIRQSGAILQDRRP